MQFPFSLERLQMERSRNKIGRVAYMPHHFTRCQSPSDQPARCCNQMGPTLCFQAPRGQRPGVLVVRLSDLMEVISSIQLPHTQTRVEQLIKLCNLMEQISCHNSLKAQRQMTARLPEKLEK